MVKQTIKLQSCDFVVFFDNARRRLSVYASVITILNFPRTGSNLPRVFWKRFCCMIGKRVLSSYRIYGGSVCLKFRREIKNYKAVTRDTVPKQNKKNSCYTDEKSSADIGYDPSTRPQLSFRLCTRNYRRRWTRHFCAIIYVYIFYWDRAVRQAARQCCTRYSCGLNGYRRLTFKSVRHKRKYGVSSVKSCPREHYCVCIPPF